MESFGVALLLCELLLWHLWDYRNREIRYMVRSLAHSLLAFDGQHVQGKREDCRKYRPMTWITGEEDFSQRLPLCSSICLFLCLCVHL